MIRVYFCHFSFVQVFGAVSEMQIQKYKSKTNLQKIIKKSSSSIINIFFKYDDDILSQ